MKPLGRWISALSLVAPLIAHADVDALAARGVAFARTLDDWPQAPLLIAVGGGSTEMPLREVRVWVDGVERARREYNLDEGRALALGGLQLIGIADVASGNHRLNVEAFAVDPAAAAYAPRARARFESTIDRPADGGVGLEISFRNADVLHAAALGARELASTVAIRSRCARFLLADGRVFEAAALAPETAPAREVETPAVVRAIERYNDAVALMETQQRAAGFDRLQQMAEDEHVESWLRDRANVVRGEQLLIAHRNADAAQSFRAVRSPGPFANRALLDLGWSALLPEGDVSEERVRPTSYALPSSADAIAQTRRRTPFRYASALATDARAEDVRRALIPWTELFGRDPFDLSVQQGMLAVPYALQHLGAQAQAVEYAQRAVVQLKTALDLLSQAATRASAELLPMIDADLDDASSGWRQHVAALASSRRWWLGEAIDPGYYGSVLLADDDFAATLEDYRTLQRLTRFLDRHAYRPDAGALRAEAQSAKASIGAQLNSRAATLIAERARITADDLAEAHLWRARIYDRTAQQVTSR